MESQDGDRAAHLLFLLGAAIMALVALYGLWKPASVFDNLQESAPPTPIRSMTSSGWSGTGRSTRPADLVSVELRAGLYTPLQYYLQDALHAEDSQWGQWNAIFSASFIPTFLVFGVLCRKFS